MPLHTDFPESPHVIIDPSIRWTPDATQLSLMGHGMLLPPLVQNIRDAVKTWRDDNYKGASETSRSLLKWWFKTPHLREQSDGATAEFQYYFAQREALKTIVYLYGVVKSGISMISCALTVRGTLVPVCLMKIWLRIVIKMATGTDKTKVMSECVKYLAKYAQKTCLSDLRFANYRESARIMLYHF